MVGTGCGGGSWQLPINDFVGDRPTRKPTALRQYTLASGPLHLIHCPGICREDAS